MSAESQGNYIPNEPGNNGNSRQKSPYVLVRPGENPQPYFDLSFRPVGGSPARTEPPDVSKIMERVKYPDDRSKIRQIRPASGGGNDGGNSNGEEDKKPKSLIKRVVEHLPSPARRALKVTMVGLSLLGPVSEGAIAAYNYIQSQRNGNQVEMTANGYPLNYWFPGHKNGDFLAHVQPAVTGENGFTPEQMTTAIYVQAWQSTPEQRAKNPELNYAWNLLQSEMAKSAKQVLIENVDSNGNIINTKLVPIKPGEIISTVDFSNGSNTKSTTKVVFVGAVFLGISSDGTTIEEGITNPKGVNETAHIDMQYGSDPANQLVMNPANGGNANLQLEAYKDFINQLVPGEINAIGLRNQYDNTLSPFFNNRIKEDRMFLAHLTSISNPMPPFDTEGKNTDDSTKLPIVDIFVIPQ